MQTKSTFSPGRTPLGSDMAADANVSLIRQGDKQVPVLRPVPGTQYPATILSGRPRRRCPTQQSIHLSGLRPLRIATRHIAGSRFPGPILYFDSTARWRRHAIMIVRGTGLYGKVDEVPKLFHVATLFRQAWFVPIVP